MSRHYGAQLEQNHLGRVILLMGMYMELLQQECESTSNRAEGCGVVSGFAQRLKSDQEWFRSKLHRGKGRGFQIATANVTSWNSSLQVFREGGFGGADIVLVSRSSTQPRSITKDATCKKMVKNG